MKCLLLLPPSLPPLVHRSSSLPIQLPHDLSNQWLVFGIFSFFSLLGHLHHHSFITAKINNKTPFFNPILPSSYHLFLCSSLQQDFLQDLSTLMISTFFSPIFLEATRDFVITNLHGNPHLQLLFWIWWPIFSTHLTWLLCSAPQLITFPFLKQVLHLVSGTSLSIFFG